jgi:uracil-DNA glycosylase family 4
MVNTNCTDCKLHKSAKLVCLWGSGPKHTKAMIVGEGPGRSEDERGRVFVGRSGQLLDQVVEKSGLTRSYIYITNATKCFPGDSKVGSREIKACRKYLEQEFNVQKPKYVALLGNVALQSVLGLKGIKKYRGRPIEQGGVTYLPMYHPAFVLRGDLKDLPLLEEDMQRFSDLVHGRGPTIESGLNSKIVETWDDVDEMIESIDGPVSMDLETTALYPWAPGAAIVTFGIGTKAGQFSLFIHHRDSSWLPDHVAEILLRVQQKIKTKGFLITQNGKFDALWLYVHYGLIFKIDFDTMMAHYLLDENNHHDLTYLAKLFFGAYDWDIPLEEKQGGASAEVIAKYHAHDLYYTRNLYFPLVEKLKHDPQIWRLFNHVTMPSVNLYMKMEANGAYIDVDRMDIAEKHLNGEIISATKGLSKWGDINWSSPKQVGNLLFNKLKIRPPIKTKKGSNSTSEDALNLIDHPCVADLKRLRAANQEWSFFIKGWRPFLVDNYLHPSFKLHGAVTGRPSCEHPNFQQTTREPRIRSLVIAPPGWELLEADLSQIELRIVAELSRESNMMRAFMTGIDIHWLTALREIERGGAYKKLVISTATALSKRKNIQYGEAIQLLIKSGASACQEIDREWAELRKKAKAVNFGYTFGMWWKRFKTYALNNYGVKLTDEECMASRVTFFQMYALEDWHKNQRKFAATHGYVRTLSGQKRRLPAAKSREDTPERAEALRQAINSPVQGFAAHMLIMVLLQLSEEFSWKVFRPFATVHDALLAHVRKDYVPRIAQRVEEIMTGPDLFKTLEIEMTVPIMGEVKIGPWGSGVSLKKWESRQ